jgi:hypothetical protein
MILRAETRRDYWEWIQFALESLNHPLHERFEDCGKLSMILVSRDELDLIIEAVTECRDICEFNWSQDEQESREEEKVLKSQLECLNETLDFLKESLVTP